MFINYSTPYVLKMYILMNLFFVLLLVSNDLTPYLLILESFTLYFGLGTIYCMLEGNCNYKVFWIFIIYILGHVASFFLISIKPASSILSIFTRSSFFGWFYRREVRDQRVGVFVFMSCIDAEVTKQFVP